MTDRAFPRLPALLAALLFVAVALPLAPPAAAFTVASNWQTPVIVSPPSPVNTNGIGSFSEGNGSVRILLEDMRNGTDTIYERFAPGSTGVFGPLTLVDSAPTGEFLCINAFQLPDGRIFVLSNVGPAATSLVRLVAFTPGGAGWGAPQTLSPPTGGHVSSCPRAVVDPDGTVAIAWAQSNPTFLSTYAGILAPTAGWAGATLLENESLGPVIRGPFVSSDGAANFTVAWTQSNGTATGLFASDHPARGSWGPRALLQGQSAYNVSSLLLRSLGSGEQLVAWTETGPATVHGWCALFDPLQGGWQAPSAIDLGGLAATPRGLSAVGTDGAALIWTATNGSLELWADRYTTAGGWGAPQRIDAPALGSVGVPFIQVSADTLGNTWSFWIQTNLTHTSVLGAYLDPLLGWQPPVVISTSDADASVPLAAFYGHGNLTVVWSEAQAWGFAVVSRSFVHGYGWTNVTAVFDDPGYDTGGYGNYPWAAPDGTMTIFVDCLETTNYTWAGTFAVSGVPYRVANPALTVLAPADGAVTSLASVEVVGKTEPGVSVAVNGMPAPTWVDGSFRVAMPVLAGNNTLTVVASHPLGFSATVTLRVEVRDLAAENQQQIDALLATVAQLNATLGAEQALVDSLELTIGDLLNATAALSTSGAETSLALNDTRAQLLASQAELAAARAQLNASAADLALARGETNASALEIALARAQLNATNFEVVLTRAELNVTAAAAREASQNASSAAASSAGAEAKAQAADARAANLQESVGLLTGVALASLAVGVVSVLVSLRGRRPPALPVLPSSPPSAPPPPQ